MVSKSFGPLRWVLTAVYAAAVLGALIVPHGHGWLNDCGCSHHGECSSAASKPTTEHSHAHCHHGHCHSHAHRHADVAAAGESPPSAPQGHEDCPYCRFLAQPIQLAAAPVLLTGSTAVAPFPIPTVAVGSAFINSAPPARGPPAA